MYVPVVVELDYKNTGPLNVPANSTQEFVLPAPAGWTGISWGWTTKPAELDFQECGYWPNEVGQQVFRATVRNTSASAKQFRFVFMLMKV